MFSGVMQNLPKISQIHYTFITQDFCGFWVVTTWFTHRWSKVFAKISTFDLMVTALHLTHYTFASFDAGFHGFSTKRRILRAG